MTATALYADNSPNDSQTSVSNRRRVFCYMGHPVPERRCVPELLPIERIVPSSEVSGSDSTAVSS
jgi:hypothetical protein